MNYISGIKLTVSKLEYVAYPIFNHALDDCAVIACVEVYFYIPWSGFMLSEDLKINFQFFVSSGSYSFETGFVNRLSDTFFLNYMKAKRIYLTKAIINVKWIHNFCW